jgi:RNA polymerase sigma-70 factor (ECF subfamily)
MATAPAGPEDGFDVAALIARARESPEALGKLIDSYRNYLLLVAREELRPGLQAKCGPSDLVQDTCLKAVRAFAGFRGQTEPELMAWLRRILQRVVLSLEEYFDADKRNVRRERPLRGPDPEDPMPPEMAAKDPSPSSQYGRAERARQLEQALQRLPEDYRQVIVWHHQDDCSFEEIGERIGRSRDAVRHLWARAVRQLKEELKKYHDAQ